MRLGDSRWLRRLRGDNSDTGNPARSRRRRLLSAAAAGCAAVCFVIAIVGHYVSAGDDLELGVVALVPWFIVLGAVFTVLVVALRSWLLLAGCVVLLAVAAGIQLPMYVSASVPARGPTLTVMTSNLRLGQAGAKALVASVTRHHVDVLMLEELTVDEQQRLEAAGLNHVLGYHASQPYILTAGTGIWSRYPLTGIHFPRVFFYAFVTAKISVPGTSAPTQLAALHLVDPTTNWSIWAQGMARLPSELRALGRSGPLVVGGDFNATADTEQFHSALSSSDSHDAVEQAGGGFAPTFPSDRWYPPVIGIDHVVTRGGAVAADAYSVQVAGSDHRALIARVTLRP